jgi:glutamyl-tRNA synthetase
MNHINRKVRVRFAPSPTGPLHPGGVRTALFNYFFAKKHGGDFILRVEDTDQTRFVPGAEDFIVESLAWCGITFDEGVHLGGPCAPYRQSERKAMYRQFAEKLVHEGSAYYAFDTPAELDEMKEKLKAAKVASPQYNAITRVNMQNSLTLPQDDVQRRLESGDPYVIRFKMPRNEEVRFKDIVRGWVVFNTGQLDDKVLLKSDGMPTYHLANVVDDYSMQISHVIRGEEWLSSTPLHVLLYKHLGWEDSMPEFAHLPLLLKPDGDGKLSKRDGDRLGLPFYAINWTDPETGNTTLGYRETGYLPEAYINFLALLGWNPGDNRELFTLEELVQEFTIERVNKHGARYDFDKLKWFNQQYLRKLSDLELAELIQPILETHHIHSNIDFLTEVARLMKDRWSFVSDCWPSTSYFFSAPTQYDEQVVSKKWKDHVPATIQQILINLKCLENWSALEIEQNIKQTCTDLTVNPGTILQPLRLVVSGEGAGPAMFEMCALFGKNEVIGRIDKAISVLGV